jgi:oligopeptide/dipeptide ABC transporter ATP-binding protein
MLDFIKDEKEAIMYSANESYREKEEAISFLNHHLDAFKKDKLDRAECLKAWKSLSKEVEEGIDKLELVKDSFAYTFSSGLRTEIDAYFNAIVKNEKETKRFEKDTKRYNNQQAKGKNPDWAVVPASITDLELKKRNIVRQVERLCDHYTDKIKAKDSRDYDKEAVDMIDYLKEQASGVVTKVTKTMAKNKAIKLMEEVGIPEPRKRYRQYPFEFSGGMRQRIVIAIALAANPDILICDEPTTALDVTIQSQILELINDFKKRRNLSVIFITHDLGVVANMADRVAVMYAGKIVEYGTADDIFYHSAHPYTWALLSSMPDLDTNEKLDAIPGTPPNMIYPPVGDAFAQRNKYAMKIDFERQPPMFKITDTHYAATWLLHPDAPKIDPPKVITDRIERMKQRRGGNNAEQ